MLDRRKYKTVFSDDDCSIVAYRRGVAVRAFKSGSCLAWSLFFYRAGSKSMHGGFHLADDGEVLVHRAVLSRVTADMVRSYIDRWFDSM